MDSQDIQYIFSVWRDHNPSPTTELDYNSTFELLIAVMLSAQATDVSVNKATKPLFAIANTPQALLDLGENTLKRYIQSIGLFNTKAKNVLKTCQILLDKYAGDVPNTRAELESLPGVGRKTANVILNTAFRQPTLAVDTHIFRVANRIGLANGKTPLAVEQQLLNIIPDEFKLDAHHWLILHGRYTCTARKPKCQDCLIKNVCLFTEKTA